jgi:hypothetical protein
MQSPFKILRRFQKVVLAFLALMAMIAFGVGDQLMKMVSMGRGAHGAVIMETNAGDLTQIGLRELAQNRRLANTFMYKALVAVNPQFEMFVRFAPGITQHFGGQSPFEMEFTWLLQHEARRLGIVVEDKQIEEYIREPARQTPGLDQFPGSDRKLTQDQFKRILSELQCGPDQLYDALRNELQLRTVQRLLAPTSSLSPEQCWEFYRQLNTRQKIEVAALPVKDFAEALEAPTDAVLTRFFESYKTRFESSADGEYRPGFRQPPKVRLHSLQLTYLDIEQQILKGSPITDKEIEEYYEAKKTLDRRFQEVETSPPATDAGAPGNPPGESADGEKRPDPPAEPSSGEAGSKGPALPENENTAPKTDDAAAGDAAAGDKESGDKESGDKGAKPESSCGGPETDKADAPAEEKPAEEKPADEKPAATGDANEKKPEADGTPAAPDEKANGKAGESAGDAAGEPAEEAGADASKGAGSDKPPVREIKFKPLDSDLREIIRESIVHERTLARMKEVSGKAIEALRDASLKFAQQGGFDLSRSNPEETGRLVERSREELEAVAKTYGLKFGDTNLLTARALSELPGIGKAQEPSASEFEPGGVRTTVDLAFESESLCHSILVESPASGAGSSRDLFIFWKVQHVPSHVPTFDEAGVRDEVLAAWRLQQALPEVKKRADELAKLAGNSKESLPAVLAGQTVTGDAKSLALAVQESPEFSWFRESTAPDMSMRQAPVQLSNPVVVTAAGMRFMEYVFNELSEGDVGVTFNDDASSCYVVKVTVRRPADREAFKSAPLFSPSSPVGSLAQRQQQLAFNGFVRQLEKAYAVKRHTPDSETGLPSDEEE